MIEQITSTTVGMLGFGGLILVIISGIAIAAWVKKEMQEEDGA